MDTIGLKNDQYIYIPEYNQLLNKETQNIFLLSKDNRKITNIDVKINKSILQEKVKKIDNLIFEITKACNMRCKYCIYGDSYHFFRKHANKHMDFNTARSGMDYIYGLVKNNINKNFFLSFYGGEPLLDAELIKEIVEYAEKKFIGFQIHSVISTNGLLLNKDSIVDFLIRKNFNVRVSLDGPKDVHDSKRISKNRKGTFDVIINNLKKIKKKNKKYFEKKIKIGVTKSPDMYLLKSFQFFKNDDLLNKLSISSSGISSNNTTYFDHIEYDKELLHKNTNTILDSIKTRLNQGKQLLPIERDAFRIIKELGERINHSNYYYTSGTCLFDSKFYIDANGNFLVCEKVNENFTIGDIEKGFDFDTMVAMANEFVRFVKSKCSRCSIRFLCKICYADASGGRPFEVEDIYCKKMKDYVKRSLERYLDFMNGVDV